MEAAEQEQGYNGWKNYETWAVKLWLDNDQDTYSYWRERVEEIRQQAPDAQQVTDGIWTAEQAARFTLADTLKEEIGEQADLWLEEGHAQSSMFADLLGAALSEVDWNEMAENYLSD